MKIQTLVLLPASTLLNILAMVWFWAQNFGADLDMIVICPGGAIFAKFCQNAQNGIIRHFKNV